MNTFHPDFPFGKGLWIWNIPVLIKQHGSLAGVVAQCKNNDISYVMIKAGDGMNTWEQWNIQTIRAFKDAGIKCLAWAYNYGVNPVREAQVAMWALDMGADGFIFDAESEFQGRPAQATQLCQLVRAHAPKAFLAYSTFPIIDSHTSFPYVEFGKYCDASMPQVYWGAFKKSPAQAINWMYDQWSKWHKIWEQGGHADSVKPLIPAGMTYDYVDPKFNLNYHQSRQDVEEFIAGVAGYGSVNFWSMQHINKQEVWDGLKQGKVIIPNTSPVVPPVVAPVVTTPPVPTTPPAPVIQPPPTVQPPVQEPLPTPPVIPVVQPPTAPIENPPVPTPVVVLPPVVVPPHSTSDKKHVDYLIDVLLFIKKIFLWRIF